MKIAWLVWYDIDDKIAGKTPEFWTTEPDSWRTYIQIVYAEIE